MPAIRLIRRPLQRPVLVLAAAGLSACTSFTLAPDYQRPPAPVPAEYPAIATFDSSAKTATIPPDTRAAADIPWSEFFADERLRGVIALALNNNRDLRVAVLNIEQAQAQYRIQRSNSFPTLNAAGSGTASRTPQALSLPGESTITRQYSASVGVTAYELDLFGRVRSLNKQALEKFFSTEQARRATQISLIAEVTDTYLQWAADLDHLQLALETLKTQEATYHLTERRAEVGLASDLTLRQQQFSVETARGDVARYTGLIAQDRDAEVFIAGNAIPPEYAPKSLQERLNLMAPLPAGLPSDLVLRRPDVLESEHDLEAANANIGAARAAFLPQITLTGSAGTESVQLSNLFGGGTAAWTFMPQITVPIFTGELNLANLKSSKIAREISVAQYERSIQSAFRDVADALAQRPALGGQIDAQQALANAAVEAFRLSEARFERGLDSYLNALDAQRTMYSAQQDLISIRLDQLSNDVTLYKALGGGWTAIGPATSIASTTAREGQNLTRANLTNPLTQEPSPK